MSSVLKLQPREEKLISVDSHVLYTDEWVMPRLPERLRPRWTEAVKKYQAESARKMGGFMPNITTSWTRKPGTIPATPNRTPS